MEPSSCQAVASSELEYLGSSEPYIRPVKAGPIVEITKLKETLGCPRKPCRGRVAVPHSAPVLDSEGSMVMITDLEKTPTCKDWIRRA